MTSHSVGIDGPELARAMRAHEKHRRIPIVMMTSLRAAVPATPGLCKAILGKPFTPDALLRVLDSVIGRDRRGRGPHRCTYDAAARFR
jgi:CheY-like chemotaxis protein